MTPEAKAGRPLRGEASGPASLHLDAKLEASRTDREQRISLLRPPRPLCCRSLSKVTQAVMKPFLKSEHFQQRLFCPSRQLLGQEGCFSRLHLDALASRRLSDWVPCVHSLSTSARPFPRSHTCSVGLPEAAP